MIQADHLNQVIDKALARLHREQQPAGNWDGKISSDTIVTAWIAYALWLGQRPEAHGALGWLVNNQNADGGWGGERDQPSFYNATCMAITVLEACNHLPPDSETGRRAHAYLACNPGKLHGLTEWLHACVTGDFNQIAPPKPGIKLKQFAYLAALFPGLLRRLPFVPRYLHESIYVMALGFAKQSDDLLSQQIRRKATHTLGLLWNLQRRWILPGLSLVGLQKFGDRPDTAVLEKAFTWLAGSQNEDGGWSWCPYGQFLDTALTVLAVLEAGVPKESPLVQNAVAWIKDQWALEGAWGPHCAAPPDADDTGAALWALISAGEPTNSSYISHAVTFLKKCQEANGAWGYPPWIGATLAEDTAIAMRGLLAAGEPGNNGTVHRGAHWLLNHQLPDGSWPARWYVQETVSSFRAVGALRAAGYSRASGVLRYASRYLLAKQQANGRFFGVVDGIEDTAYALIALTDLEEPTHPAIQEGINWLLKQQLPDGSWPVAYNGYMADTEGAWMSFYRDGMWCHAHCLWALAKYRNCLSPVDQTKTRNI